MIVVAADDDADPLPDPSPEARDFLRRIWSNPACRQMLARLCDNDETPQPDAAPPVTDQEPQEGVTYYMDGDAFLLMLRQHLGMPDDA